MNYSDSTPIAALSVADFKELINSLIGQESQPAPQQKRLVYGIKGIEELFNCCHLTAQRYKKTFLAPAIKQRGRKIIVDAEYAIELFKEHEEQERKAREEKNLRNGK